MARFSSPATWGRTKPTYSNTTATTRDLNNSATSTASLNQSNSQSSSSTYDAHHHTYHNKYSNGGMNGGGGGAASSVGGGSHHPYASNSPAPTPIVSQDTNEPDEVCPVCLESLSFSFRLPGEKPHIVPECGHALHEVSHNRFRLFGLNLVGQACVRISILAHGELCRNVSLGLLQVRRSN